MVPPISLGTLLRQRYLIQEVLGQGGFGRTYLAIDQERFGERCVLKEFSVSYQDEDLVQKSQALFQREASTLYQIQHPQIPRFWAAFEEAQRLFLVQDFVEGQTYRKLLSDRLQKQQTFSESEVQYFLSNLLPVLTYIHEHGIVHRDISPENVVLKPQAGSSMGTPVTVSGLPVLIDFGAVKEATAYWNPNSSITRVGKVGYAPPEQLQTGQVYPNSDLYALAASCLALLTGKEPRSLMDSKTLEWRWQPYASLSPKLASILERMLSIYPGDRYQSAQAVWADLQLIQADFKSNGIEFSRSKPFQQPLAAAAEIASTVLNTSDKPTNQFKPPSFPGNQSNLLQQKSQHRSSNAQGIIWGIVAAFLLGSSIAGAWVWKTLTNNAAQNEEVWVSGSKLPQSEASRIIGSGVNSANSALPLPPGVGAAPNASIAQPQPIQFPPGKISTSLPGTVQTNSPQSYMLTAEQGQILTATLDGPGVVMNLLRANQEGIDAAAYQTHSWTGQLPANDRYLIQVAGSGSYTLDVAVTPVDRPTQDRTERVAFARGSNGTTVTGTLSSKQIRRYLLKAKQGQIVLIKVLQGKISFSTIAPNGQRIGGSATNSKDWKGRLPIAGDYVIEISTTQPTDYALSFEIF